MLLVLAVCVAPAAAAGWFYFIAPPTSRTNYGTLIEPARPMPADLPLTDLEGRAVSPASLPGQWLLVVVAGGACDATCERHLWLQRQLRETLGRDMDRVDKVWLIPDGAAPAPAVLDGVGRRVGMTVLRVPRGRLAAWLEAEPGHALEDHLYIVDPVGHWMMRSPSDPEPARLKRDVDKLLRASAGWDRAGR